MIEILQLVHLDSIKDRLQKIGEGKYDDVSEYDTIDINKIHK